MEEKDNYNSIGEKMNELDLHGVEYDNVLMICHRFINDNWGTEMKIITGNSTALKNIVTRIIRNYDLPHRIGGITLPYITIQKENL